MIILRYNNVVLRVVIYVLRFTFLKLYFYI